MPARAQQRTPPNARRPEVPKYVYVREDLVRELMDRAADRGESKTSDDSLAEVTSIVARIREADLVIVHDGRCWSLKAGQ